MVVVGSLLQVMEQMVLKVKRIVRSAEQSQENVGHVGSGVRCLGP